MKFFSLDMADFSAARSVHIYASGRIVNKKDKDRNVYVYDDEGELTNVIAPGSSIKFQ